MRGCIYSLIQYNKHIVKLPCINGTGQERTYVEPEVSLEHGAEILGHIGHAGVKGRHQAGVEGEQIQPGGEKGKKEESNENNTKRMTMAPPFGGMR